MTKRSSLARDISDALFDRFHISSSATHLEVIAFLVLLGEIFDLRSSSLHMIARNEVKSGKRVCSVKMRRGQDYEFYNGDRSAVKTLWGLFSFSFPLGKHRMSDAGERHECHRI